MKKRYNVKINEKEVVVEVVCSNLEWQYIDWNGHKFWELLPSKVLITELALPNGRSIPDKEIEYLLERNKSIYHLLGMMAARDRQEILLS